jgi:phage tail sheath protein FI
MGKQQFCTFILIDGKVDGRIKCTTSIDKSCVGFKLSHAAATGKNDDIKDLNNGGIYFLFGKREDETSGCEGTFYVGQAAVRKNEKGLLQRINENHKPLLKWNWETVIIFTTNNSDLDSAQINYLENKFYNLAKNAKRYEMKNKQEPHKGIVKITSEISANQFVEAVILITEFLGFRVFETKNNSCQTMQLKTKNNQNVEAYDENEELLHIAGTKIAAMGKCLGNSFIVCKGSHCSLETTKSCKDGIIKLRTELMKNGTIKNGMFVKDYKFTSPTKAAETVLGSTVNGLVYWLDNKNKTLKEIRNK